MRGGSYFQRIAQRAAGDAPSLRPMPVQRESFAAPPATPGLAPLFQERELPLAAPRVTEPPFTPPVAGPVARPGGDVATPATSPISSLGPTLEASRIAHVATAVSEPSPMSPARPIVVPPLPEHPRAEPAQESVAAALSGAHSREASPLPERPAPETPAPRRPLVRRNVAPGPDPLIAALSAAVRWTSSDATVVGPAKAAPSRAVAGSLSEVSETPQPSEGPPVSPQRRQPISMPKVASAPVVEPAKGSARNEAAPPVPRAAPVPPREHGESASERPRVHIGSVDVQIVPQPAAAPVPRAAPPAPARPLARGLTSIIGLRQS